LIGNKNLKIYSFGGFVQYGIKRNLNFAKNIITLQDLEKILEESAEKNLIEMREKYPNYLVDNQAGTILLHAIIKSLQANEILYVNHDPKDHLALNPAIIHTAQR